LIAGNVDPAALGEQVEDALFGAGNIHCLDVRRSARKRAHKNVAGVA
jgi:hypothetical protein